MTYEYAFGQASAQPLPCPISVSAIAAPFLGSPLADYYFDSAGATDKTNLGKLGPLNTTILDAVLAYLGNQPGIIQGLRPSVRQGVTASLWPSLPHQRWMNVPGNIPIPYFAYSGDANWGQGSVNITSQQTAGFPLITPSLGAALYNFVGQTADTKAIVQQVCGWTTVAGTAVDLCQNVKIVIPITRPAGQFLTNDFIVDENSANPAGYQQHRGIHAHHLDIVGVSQNQVAANIHANDTVLLAIWVVTRPIGN